jgi:acyl-CoA synthetase (AMP-forming)/AMP-acid ligase II
MLLLAVAKIFRRWKSKAPCCDISRSRVAIVGMPDERWGEVPHALVVLKAGATATETELRNYARDQSRSNKACELTTT